MWLQMNFCKSKTYQNVKYNPQHNLIPFILDAHNVVVKLDTSRWTCPFLASINYSATTDAKRGNACSKIPK